jgi:iron complex outermembrane recepter protein
VLLPLRYSPAPGVTTYRAGAQTRPLSPPLQLDSYAGFVQAKVKAGPLIVQGGVRREEFRPKSKGKVLTNFFGAGQDLVYLEGDMPSFDATLFNAGVVWSVTPDIEVFAGLSQGLEVTELGRAFRSLGARNRPADPALVEAQPSKTTQYEVGFRGDLGPLRLTASAYYSDAPLSAQLVVVSPLLPLEPLRQPEEIWGFEATADYRVNDQITVGGVFTYQDGTFEDATGEEFDLPNDRIAPPRLTAYVEAEPFSDVGVRVQATQIFDRSQFPSSEPLVFGRPPEGNVDGYLVVDLLVTAKVGPGRVSLAVENLLNKRYIPVEAQAFNDIFDYFPGEGTRVTLGYQFAF